MVSFSKLYFSASALIVLFSFTSCNQENKENIAVLEPTESSSSTIFVSNDHMHEYVVIANPGSTDGKIMVHDSKNNKDYALQRVESKSDVIYKSEDGYVLWTKGSAFKWSKGDETIAIGQLKTTEIAVEKELEIPEFNNANFANYVNSDYAKKDEDYDWVALMVEPIDKFRVKLSVRSRGDKKKGTCTYDGVAQVSGANTLKVSENGMNIIFTFKDNAVTIATDQDSAHDKLTFFCSGGSNLAGTYFKLDEELDKSQIDKTGYSKYLVYNNIIFSIEENGGVVIVTPSGIEATNIETYPVSGEIINAEVDDLNNDTFPELLIYTKSGVDKIGEVIGYSVNDGKSVSMINISKISEITEVNQGYQGHDEFAMVEGTFIQRFPIYENNQTNGKTRQIQYKLEDSEGTKQLVIDKFMDY